MAVLVKVIAVCLVVSVLLLPVMLLYLVPMSNQGKAWTTFGFVFGFSIAMCVVTEARVHEILIGTAAYDPNNPSKARKLTPTRYGAVLVTLLGNLNSGTFVVGSAG